MPLAIGRPNIKDVLRCSFFMKKFFKFWFPVLIWTGFIFILSSLPNLKSGLEQDFILRKIAHILEYAILTFLLFRAGISAGWQIKKAIILSIIIAFLYALTDEYHQTFVSGRQGRLKDVGFDSIGVLIVSLVWYYKNVKLKIKNYESRINRSYKTK